MHDGGLARSTLASILVIICKTIVVSGLVGMFVIFLRIRKLCLCKVEEDDIPKSFKESFICMHFLVCCHHHGKQSTPSTPHDTPFRDDALFGEDQYIPSFKQCNQISPTLALLALVRNWYCSRQQETERKQEKEEVKTFCSEGTVDFGPKSERLLN